MSERTERKYCHTWAEDKKRRREAENLVAEMREVVDAALQLSDYLAAKMDRVILLNDRGTEEFLISIPEGPLTRFLSACRRAKEGR